MKKYLLLLSLLSPFLVCDPQAGVTYYMIDDPWFQTPHPAEPDGSIRYDVGLATGMHNINARACDERGCSTPAPFPSVWTV
jgi:hypothetical protein